MNTGWWVTEALNASGMPFVVSWVFWIIFSIVMHELAHGWAAIRCGDDTPIRLGHMTWNPIVHMGWMGIILFALVGIAFGRMPVDRSRFRRRHDDALVSAAGPAMNILLAIIAAALYIVWCGTAGGAWFGSTLGVSDTLWHNSRVFLSLGVVLNVVLAAFNLAPVPPLDGSRILSSFIRPLRPVFETPQAAMAGLFLMILVSRSLGSGWIDLVGLPALRGLHALTAILAPSTRG